MTTMLAQIGTPFIPHWLELRPFVVELWLIATIVAVLLTSFANVILAAGPIVWAFTLPAAAIVALTLASLGVAMGAYAPNFAAENPLQVGLSLGGFGYMAVSLAYVGFMMLLTARPVMQYFFWRMFHIGFERPWLTAVLPVAAAVLISIVLMVVPMRGAAARLARLKQTR